MLSLHLNIKEGVEDVRCVEGEGFEVGGRRKTSGNPDGHQGAEFTFGLWFV